MGISVVIVIILCIIVAIVSGGGGIIIGMLLSAWLGIKREDKRKRKEQVICYYLAYGDKCGASGHAIQIPCDAKGIVNIPSLSPITEQWYAEILSRGTVEGTPVVKYGVFKNIY